MKHSSCIFPICLVNSFEGECYSIHIFKHLKDSVLMLLGWSKSLKLSVTLMISCSNQCRRYFRCFNCKFPSLMSVSLGLIGSRKVNENLDEKGARGSIKSKCRGYGLLGWAGVQEIFGLIITWNCVYCLLREVLIVEKHALCKSHRFVISALAFTTVVNEISGNTCISPKISGRPAQPRRPYPRHLDFILLRAPFSSKFSSTFLFPIRPWLTDMSNGNFTIGTSKMPSALIWARNHQSYWKF